MATPIHKVAVFGASGNFGTPITAALTAAGFAVTVITRTDSTSTFPAGLPVIRVNYADAAALTAALQDHDAAVCVVGPAGVHLQTAMIDAAVAAGVRRFVIDDFGWGPDAKGYPEMDAIHEIRKAQWAHAKMKAEESGGKFTWTGISSGNPIDWALRRFTLMGFNPAAHTATIYDDGTERFTGTTLEGIGAAVAGVLQRPDETANRFVRVMSIDTCQNELLAAFQAVSGREWTIERSTVKALLEDGRVKYQEGKRTWTLPLAVSMLFEPGMGRGRVAVSRDESEAELVGVREETAEAIVRKVMGS